MPETERPISRYERRLKALEQEANTWVPHWQQLSDYLLPRKGRFLGDQPNDGDRRNRNIIDGTATRALRTLAAGMQGGLTSPARPWFRLGLQDKDLMEFGPVKQWLHIVRERMLAMFSGSNFYNVVHSLYQELGGFGTGAMIVEADEQSGLRCRPFTIGEYYLALDSTYRVNTIYRKLWMTVAQLVGKFGLEKVSRHVKDAYDRGNYDLWIEVVHLVEPRELSERTPGARDNQNMPFKSVYYERGRQESENAGELLRESGYVQFPVMAPRWDVTGVEIYGRCPGMDALGDIKMLQKMQEKGLKALDKVVDPPMGAATELKTQKKSTVPGGITYFDSAGQGQQGFAPLYQINPDFNALEFKLQRVQDAIHQNFFTDLFLMLANSDKQMTATEVAERHDEKLLMLGPVLERLQAEMLDPLIDRVFYIMMDNGQIPKPPQELEGQPLEVEYISLLAQAQKMVGTTAVEQLGAFVGNLTAVYQDASDKFDADEAINQYAEMLGVPPELIRSDEDVMRIRQARRRELEEQKRMEQAQEIAQGAKTLSEAEVGNNSALDVLVGGMGGQRG